MRPVRLLVLVCLVPTVAFAQSRTEDQPFVTQGALLVNEANRVIKVPLKQTRVSIQVTGHLAEARVVQVFQNPHPKPIEAIYIFPLPVSAAISGFTLTSGKRRIVGKLLPKGKAEAVYRRARRAGQVAALLTQQRPNLFTQKVANLAPGQQIKVELRYTERLRHEAGAYELVFPMVAGPRFVPRKKRRGGRVELLSPPVLPPDLRSSHDIQLAVRLAPGLALQAVRSVSHQIWTKPLGQGQVEVRLQDHDKIPNKDFVLSYRVAGEEPKSALHLHRPDQDRPGYFMLTLHPPEARAVGPALPREVIIVLDTSSSMTGAPLDRARTLASGCLGALGPRDTFQIVRFAEGAATLGPRMIRNTPRNISLARTWLSLLRAGGGTYVDEGLKVALELPHDAARLRLVVFISDGYVGNEEQILSLLNKQIDTARLFTFGVGSAVNRYLLEEMALAGRGAASVIGHDQSAAEAVERFTRRIDTPVLTHLKLELQGARAFDLAPARLPDLFAGEPLTLLGRYTGQNRFKVVVRGRRGQEMVTMTALAPAGTAALANAPVSRAWARERMAALERRRIRDSDPALAKQVAGIALRHGLLSRYTAFVAADEQSFVAGKAVKVHVAVDRPAGLMRQIGTAGYGGMAMTGSGYGGGGTGAYSLGLTKIAATRAVASPPRIVVGHAKIVGSLDKETIRRTIRSQLNQVRNIYEQALKATPGLKGRVVVRMTIGEDGKVLKVQIDSSTLNSAEVAAGLLKVIKTWTFPKTRGGGVVEVNYPFVFKSTKEE